MGGASAYQHISISAHHDTPPACPGMLQAVCTLSSGLKEMFGDFTNRQIISNATAVKGRFLRPADAEMLLRWGAGGGPPLHARHPTPAPWH